jgi:hypothetical protein
MTTSYVIRITEARRSKEVLVAIFNIAGAARMQFGYGDTGLWVLPNSKKSKQEVIEQLQALVDIQSFSVINLSKPVRAEEATKVREVINGFNIDTSRISDDQLCAFLDSIIDGKQTFYVDFVDDPPPKTHAQILIKPVEEHPDFSPEWLEQRSLPEDDETDREYTVDDFEIETFEVGLDDEKQSRNRNPKRRPSND